MIEQDEMKGGVKVCERSSMVPPAMYMFVPGVCVPVKSPVLSDIDMQSRGRFFL